MSNTKVTVDGVCTPAFEGVREAFIANFELFHEVGAAFCATVDGQAVVDIWAGHADAGRLRPWRRDTIVNVYSTTKLFVATTAHMLVDRGLLELDAPVARYWPEFGQAGKERVTVRQLLCHQAGVPGVSSPVPGLTDWQAMTEALATEPPWWEPGSVSGYHALVSGHLVGMLVRRTDGRTLPQFVRDEITGPLDADFLISFGPEEDSRVAELLVPEPEPLPDPPPDMLLFRVLSSPPWEFAEANSREWRAAEVSSANGHGTARAVARLMSALAMGGTLDGVTLMQRETLAEACSLAWEGNDVVLGQPLRWALGYALAPADGSAGPNPRTFGHTGAGGSGGFADADRRLAWAYTMNRMRNGPLIDERLSRLTHALYQCL